MCQWNDFKGEKNNCETHCGLCQCIFTKSEIAEVENICLLYYEWGSKVSDPTSALPVTLNTPLDKCLSLFFHLSVLHKFTSIESSGSAVLFTTCDIKSQYLGKVCSAQTGQNRGTWSLNQESKIRLASSSSAWYADAVEHRQHSACRVKNAPYGLMWPLCSGWKYKPHFLFMQRHTTLSVLPTPLSLSLCSFLLLLFTHKQRSHFIHHLPPAEPRGARVQTKRSCFLLNVQK